MKIRLDQALVQRGLVTGRDRAKAVIMAGVVYVNNQKSDKAGAPVSDEDQIEIRGETLRYVSRGGLKLEKALDAFPIDLDGALCCDFGASTGGFTDCMLQNGARRVYAFDVGYGQLAWKLRQDERVVNLERTNVRRLPPDAVTEPVDFISIDVSFISLSLVLPTACALLRDGGQIICLVKPQFEAGREKVGKKGVVRDPEVHKEVLYRVYQTAEGLGFSVKGLSFSPIKGPEGNIEYLMFLEKEGTLDSVPSETIETAVEQAHSALDH